MEPPEIWQHVKGWDSDGISLFHDIEALGRGELGYEAGDLLTDLIRESLPSSAAYPAIPLLLAMYERTPRETGLEILLVIAFIVTRSGEPEAPVIPQELSEYFSDQFRRTLGGKLLEFAAREPLDPLQTVGLAATLVDLQGRKDLHDYLMDHCVPNPEPSATIMCDPHIHQKSQSTTL